MAKILIIGGGVSGLSAGIFARLDGGDVTVYEAHGRAGGNLTGWQRGDYKIDNCIHWLTGTNPSTDTYKTWVTLGALGDVKVTVGESLYTCEHGGQTLSLYSDLDRLHREMLYISPRDKREIDSLFCAVDFIKRYTGVGGGLTAKDILSLPLLLRYCLLSAEQLSRKFRHPLLRTFIRAFWGDEFGALALIAVIATFGSGNGGLPEGGSAPMAERMAARFISLGGRLETGKRVVKVNISEGVATSVELADGSIETADYIIYSGDPFAAFGSIIPLPLPRRLKRLNASRRARMFSSIHCAFACPTELIPFTGDYIFNVRGGGRVILRELSHESASAPDGETVLQTMTFTSREESDRFIRLRDKDKVAYEREKSRYARSQERLICHKFPCLVGKLKLIDAWTPATYRRYTGAPHGSYMSFTLPSRTLPVRMSPRVKGVKNLLLATQWQQSPGGLPTAAECGRRSAARIARMERLASNAPKAAAESAAEQ